MEYRKNIKYLQGNNFYWPYECSSIKEILEYDGTTTMIFLWEKEIIGYHFTVIFREDHMMDDVDALICRLGPLIAKKLVIDAMLRERDQLQHPRKHATATSLSRKTSKI